MAKKRSYRKRPKTTFTLGVLHIAPILFVLSVLPLIVLLKVVDLTVTEQLLFNGQETRADFYSHYKSIYFIIAMSVQILIFVYLSVKTPFKLKLTVYDVLIAIYLCVVVLSVWQAADAKIAMRGIVELHQGGFVLLGYGLMIFFGIHLIRHHAQVQWIAIALIFSGVIIGILGITQFFGFDWFKTPIGQYFILPSAYKSLVGELNFTFDKFTIYATMYNTNFVGSYAALMVPFALGLLFWAKTRKWFIYAAIFFALMVLVWLGSNSRAGLVGVIPGLIIMCVLARKTWLKAPLKALVPIALILFVGLVLNTVSGGTTFGQVRGTNPLQEAERLEGDALRTRFEAINLDGKSIEIITEDASLRMRQDGAHYVFEMIDGTPLTPVRVDDTITLVEPEYAGYKVDVNVEENHLMIYAYDKSFPVYPLSTGFYVIAAGGATTEIVNADRFEPLDGYERFASGRGYIWSRSMPLLKDNIITGVGPDLYPTAFPQNDFSGRMNGFNERLTILFPHNMYLQIWINTGLVSLLALLAMIAIYSVNALFLFYNKRFESLTDFMALSTFIGIMAYMLAALFNDQIISVAPMFYVLLGIGISLNMMIKVSFKETSV